MKTKLLLLLPIGVVALVVVLNRIDHREMQIKDANIASLEEQLHPTRAKTFHETNMIPTVPPRMPQVDKVDVRKLTVRSDVVPDADLVIVGLDANQPWLRLTRKHIPVLTNSFWQRDTSWAATNCVMQTDHKPHVTRSNQFWIITFESKGE